MNLTSRLVIGLAFAAAASAASAQVTFFESDNFQGRSFKTNRAVGDFSHHGFNDYASSVIVRSGNWQLCVDGHYQGRCVVLRPGRYASLSAMGLNDRISSARMVGAPPPRPPPPPPPR
jgi:hypothetical protein